MLKTKSRICFSCGITLPEKKLTIDKIPKTESGTPEYYISKIIMFCPNEHPNECEVDGF